ARLSEALHIDDSLDLKTLLSLPGVLSGRELQPVAGGPVNSAVSEAVRQGVQQALAGLLSMRELEGEALRRDLGQQLEGIAQKAKQIRELAPQDVSDYRQRLTERLAQVIPQNGIDPQRLAQEVALAAERCDVSEELTRLESHVDQFSEWMASASEVGK